MNIPTLYIIYESVCIEIQDQEDHCIGQQCTPRRGWLHWRRNREGQKKPSLAR